MSCIQRNHKLAPSVEGHGFGYKMAPIRCDWPVGDLPRIQPQKACIETALKAKQAQSVSEVCLTAGPSKHGDASVACSGAQGKALVGRRVAWSVGWGWKGLAWADPPFRPAAAAWESQSSGVHCLNLLLSFSTAAKWRGIQQ